MDDKEKIVDDLLARSIALVLPSKDELKKALLSGEKLRIYSGYDATAPKLHLGHSTNFILLEKLRRLGHEIVVLFGNFTARIGDPSDKTAARVRLNEEEVEKNIGTWKEQVSPILNFDDSENPARIVRNADWLSKLTFEDVINLSSNFTVQQMLERDMFQARLKEEKPIYLHEFFYPLMQGYDSVHLNVDVEIGGTDQTFNMLMGRTLQRKYHNKEKFVISTTLLTNPTTGKKLMSKSEGGYIALNDNPRDMFGKTMALPDETIIQMFVDCTFVPLSEIGEFEKAMDLGNVNPRDLKMRLAEEITRIYHGDSKAWAARDDFNAAFRDRGIPQNIPEFSCNSGTLFIDIATEAKLVSSRSEYKRLVGEGGVSFGEAKIDDFATVVGRDGVFKIGKHKFIKIVLK